MHTFSHRFAATECMTTDNPSTYGGPQAADRQEVIVKARTPTQPPPARALDTNGAFFRTYIAHPVHGLDVCDEKSRRSHLA